MISSDTEQDMQSVARGFKYGLRTGMPIAIGYIPSALACGILCKTAAFTPLESVFMSFIVFAGASQFVAINLLLLGSAIPEIILATAVLNMRLVMMSSALGRKLEPGVNAVKKILIFFEMTDESFSVAAMQKESKLSPEFMFGLNIVGHCTWTLGTLLGYYSTSVLPDSVQDSMGMALYALFIGLLIPSVRRSMPALVVAIVSMALSSVIKWTPFLSTMNRGIAIIGAAGLAALLGAVLFPLRKECNDD
jgi:4-azaleucine resistance transporter AzlC